MMLQGTSALPKHSANALLVSQASQIRSAAPIVFAILKAIGAAERTGVGWLVRLMHCLQTAIACAAFLVSLSVSHGA